MHSCVVHSLLESPLMNSILRVWVLSVASALALSGCGGGDGPGPSDDSGLPPTSACLPTAEVMSERIDGKSSYAEANVAGQSTHSVDCGGVMGTQAVLTWGHIESGPYLTATIKDNKLLAFSSQRL